MEDERLHEVPAGWISYSASGVSLAFSPKLHDNKDDWYVEFSCTSLLFHALTKGVEDYLAATRTEFRKNEETVAFGSLVAYHLSSFPFFSIKLEREGAGSIALTKVTIADIGISTVNDAKVLVDVVNHIIEDSRKTVINTVES